MSREYSSRFKSIAYQMIIQKMLISTVVILLIFSTFSFGGVHATSLFIIRMLILLTALIQIILFFFENNYFDNINKDIIVPIVIFLIFIVFTWMQYWGGLNILKGGIIGSFNPKMTRDSIFQLLFYFMFFVAMLKISKRVNDIDGLISAIIVIVFLTTVIGLIVRLSGSDKIYGFIYCETGMFFGPFINENHYGGFLAISCPLLLFGMHYRLGKVRGEYEMQYGQRMIRSKSKYLNMLMDSGAFFIIFLVILTLVGAFYSQARSAAPVVLSAVIGYLVSYGLSQKNTRIIILMIIILLISAIILYEIKFAKIEKIYFYDQIERALRIRWSVICESLKIFQKYPVCGIGLGTYLFISSIYVSFGTEYHVWRYVHNDFIQLLIESGIIGTVLWLVMILALIVVSIRLFKKGGRFTKWRIAQAMLALISISVVECFDYHLKIPAIALLFVIQLAMLSNLSDTKEIYRKESKRIKKDCINDHKLGRGMKIIIAIVMLSAIASLGWYATNQFRVYRLMKDTEEPIESINKAIAIDPINSDLYCSLGEAYYKEWVSETGHYRESIKIDGMIALRKAVSITPTFAHYWFVLGSTAYKFGYAEEGITYLTKACELSPWKTGYALHLISLLMRESEIEVTKAMRLEYVNKAKLIYLNKKEAIGRLTERDRVHWMGQRYYDRLKSYEKMWSQSDESGQNAAIA